MGKISNCPLCKKEFGLFRHRYTCAVCQGTFCDDCTPNKYVVPPAAEAESVCTGCEANLASNVKTKDGGHKLGTGTGTSSGAGHRTAGDEREERARAAEQRALKQKGGGATAAPKPTARSATTSSEIREVDNKPSVPPQQSLQSSGRTAGGDGAVSSDQPPVNAVLAAALKREQQGKRPQPSGPQMDPERRKILEEIQAILRQRDEDEPFGLRAMDATKMRIYLKDLTARKK